MLRLVRSLRRMLPVGVRHAGRHLERSARLRARSLPYRVKNVLHLLTPGGWGYQRTLRRLRDPSYDLARDMHPVRRKHYGQEGWRPELDTRGFRRRDYDSYDEYLLHQQQKFTELLKLGLVRGNRSVAAARRRFYSRFRHLVTLLPRDARILCAGARDGTEVEVLRDLGFRRAIGIDLNPGPGNTLVRRGDFQALDLPDDSLDLLYSNSLDHAFDLEALFEEHARVVKPTGYVLYDVPRGAAESGGAAESYGWEREDDVLRLALSRFARLVRLETAGGWKWMLLREPVKPRR